MIKATAGKRYSQAFKLLFFIVIPATSESYALFAFLIEKEDLMGLNVEFHLAAGCGEFRIGAYNSSHGLALLHRILTYYADVTPEDLHR